MKSRYQPDWYKKYINMQKDNPHDKTQLSEGEFRVFHLRERIPTIELVKKIKLNLKSNAREDIDLELTPYHKLPLKMIGKQIVLFIYAIAPTQSGKTLLALIFVADRIDQSPGDMMYCLPTETSGRTQFKLKVIALIRDTPLLNKHCVAPISQTMSLSGITLDHMSILPAWSNSTPSMNSVTAVGGVIDEIRLMPVQLPDGGNCIEYIWDRSKTHMRSGKAQYVGVTTPSHEGDLMHRQLNKPKTLILWFMSECQKCKKMQVLDIYENFVFDLKEQVYLPICICKYCDYQFDDSNEKREMNARGYYGEWEEQGKLREHLKPIVEHLVMIFRWTSEVSPFTSFEDITDKYAMVKDDYAGLTNFNQCWRARFEAKSTSEITPELLKKRISKKIKRAVVPEWCKVLTMGIDSQGDGFYWCTLASGSDKKTAIIEYGFLQSHYPTDSDETVQAHFKKHFERKTYSSAKGVEWAIGLWAIDTGGNRTSQIYDAVSGFKKCVPCKGSNAKQEENIKNSKSEKLSNLYLVNTFNYLGLTDNICMSDTFQLAEGTGTGFLRQYCNLRIVEDAKADKHGQTPKYVNSLGQTDYRITHLHAEIAKDVRMDYGRTFREELEIPDFTYNPISIIRDYPDPDRGKARTFAGQNKPDPGLNNPEEEDFNYQTGGSYVEEGYGEFTEQGAQM